MKHLRDQSVLKCIAKGTSVLTHFVDIGLHPVKGRVAATLVDQLVVRPILHQSAAIDGDDTVTSANG